MNFSNQTILVTGGTAGIGLELAKAFHADGAHVIIAGRRQALLDQITADHPGMTGYPLDMSDAKAVRDFAVKVTAAHPALSIVVHNAGIMQAEQLTADPSPLSIAEDTIATNLMGPIRLTHALLPQIIGKPNSAIITVSSGLAFVPLAMTPTYSATKAAIHSWSQSLRQQLRDTGTRVLEIAPPAVQTDLMPGSKTNPNALPLDDFIAETMTILHSDPTPDEVCVERVKFLSNAEKEGRYDQVFQMLNGTPRA